MPKVSPIPREHPSLRTRSGRRFKRHCQVLQDTYGPLPEHLMPRVREAALIEAELGDIKATGSRRLILRQHLLMALRQLETFASPKNGRHDLVATLQDAQASLTQPASGGEDG